MSKQLLCCQELMISSLKAHGSGLYAMLLMLTILMLLWKINTCNSSYQSWGKTMEDFGSHKCEFAQLESQLVIYWTVADDLDIILDSRRQFNFHVSFGVEPGGWSR